jgi:hypothetical protein
MRLVTGKLGNAETGVTGFMDYWLGNYMQETRTILHNKARNSHEHCSKCNFTQSRGDIPCWDDDAMEYFWENNKWNKNKVKLTEIIKSGFDLS